MRPDPNAIVLTTSLPMPRSCSAAHEPTTSAMESNAPTSWKCTSSTAMACTRASAPANRSKTRMALSRTGSTREAPSTSERMAIQVR